MSATAETRLHERIAQMTVRTGPMPGRWQVQSASDPTLWHTVRIGPAHDWADLTCSCQGGKGRCSHKRAIAARLGIAVPEPPAAARHRSKPVTPPPADDAPDADLMTFRVSIPPTQSAVMQHGLDGGYRIVITTDPAEEEAVHAFVRACRGRSLRLVVVDDGEARP